MMKIVSFLFIWLPAACSHLIETESYVGFQDEKAAVDTIKLDRSNVKNKANRLLSTEVTAITDTASLQTAVTAWCNDPAAESTYGHISGWNTGEVTDMSRLFIDYCRDGTGAALHAFNEDISAWNVSSVTNMNSMFYNGLSFDQDISAWDVGSVMDMSDMFFYAQSFNQDISAWDVRSVTKMKGMFRSASSFDQDISAWDISSVTDMTTMFMMVSGFNQVLCWNISHVTTKDMFFFSGGSIDTDYANCSSTSNPTSSPTSPPSSSPTPECHDTTWTDQRNGKGCDWVARKPDKRCTKRSNSTNMVAYEGCPLTCDNCEFDGCYDDKTWADARNGKDCFWIARNPDKRCTKRSSSVADGGVSANDACLFTCGNCNTNL